MAFTDLFSEKAATYAQVRPTYPDALFELIARHAPAHERAWDCATGNGQAAIGLARHFAAVEATDASREQIAHAIETPGVRYSVQAAEATDFPARSFDAVCVAQALHWFDLRRFHDEVRRVVKPRGVIAVWGYDRMSVTPEIDTAVQHHVIDVVKSYWPKENARLWGGYRSMDFPFAPIEAPPMAVEVRWTLPQLFDYLETWTATRRCAEAQGRSFLRRAAAEMAGLWGEGPRLVTMPMHVRIGLLPAAGA